MLDFPELFAPARRVNGRISIVCSAEIDLKPLTESVVIVGGLGGESSEFPFDFDMMDKPFARQFAVAITALSQEQPLLGSDSRFTQIARERHESQRGRMNDGPFYRQGRTPRVCRASERRSEH
jgi:hypothetical protein